MIQFSINIILENDILCSLQHWLTGKVSLPLYRVKRPRLLTNDTFHVHDRAILTSFPSSLPTSREDLGTSPLNLITAK